MGGAGDPRGGAGREARGRRAADGNWAPGDVGEDGWLRVGRPSQEQGGGKRGAQRSEQTRAMGRWGEGRTGVAPEAPA